MKTEDQNYLHEYIHAILNNETLKLDEEKVTYIIENELDIGVKNTTTQMKSVLYECLCYYIRIWPGWKNAHIKCQNDQLTKEYYEKFRRYLNLKLGYIVVNKDIFTTNSNERKTKDLVSKEIQTDPINKENIPEAPYNIIITGQPSYLNTLGFFEVEDNVVIQHHRGQQWTSLSYKEFFNYPFLKVKLKLPCLELSRDNSTEFMRYISDNGKAWRPETKFLEYVKKIKPNDGVTVYTLDYINAYCKQFIEAVRNLHGVPLNKLVELGEILKQFTSDIKESHVHECKLLCGSYTHTMATNTSIRFNIGKKVYYRNKKCINYNFKSAKNRSNINFIEILTPKLTYSLDSFTAVEDLATNETTFKDLKEMAASSSLRVMKWNKILNNCFTYECTFCKFSCTGTNAFDGIYVHFKELHRGEEPVMCFCCRKTLNVSKLAGDRWAHCCSENNTIQKDQPQENLLTEHTKNPICNSNLNSAISKEINSKQLATDIVLNNLRAPAVSNPNSVPINNISYCNTPNNISYCNTASGSMSPFLLNPSVYGVNRPNAASNNSGNTVFSNARFLPKENYNYCNTASGTNVSITKPTDFGTSRPNLPYQFTSYVNGMYRNSVISNTRPSVIMPHRRM